MNEFTIHNWQDYFKDIGVQEEFALVYLSFVEECFQKKIPPIFELEHLALLLGLKHDDLVSMIYGTDSFYREFNIRKRLGGNRRICAPYPSLLEAQRWINNNILSSVSLSICASGFRKKRSIKSNAQLHCGRDQVLKIDIKDFFPSISLRRVMSVYLKLGYPENVALALSKLCVLDDELPQGAATSPTLSNIICKRMDNRIYQICKKHRLRYTRYADDIVISGVNIPKGIRRLFFEIVEDEGFVINSKKVRFLKKDERKIVTGLDITNGIVRPTRKFRREIQKDLYFVWSAGLSTHVARRRIFAPNYIEQLAGRVQFWLSIEPENSQAQKAFERVKIIQNTYRS